MVGDEETCDLFNRRILLHEVKSLFSVSCHKVYLLQAQNGNIVR